MNDRSQRAQCGSTNLHQVQLLELEKLNKFFEKTWVDECGGVAHEGVGVDQDG